MQLDEREGAEQRGEAAQKRLAEVVTTVTSILGLTRGGPAHLLPDQLAAHLTELIKEVGSLRRERAELEEGTGLLRAEVEGARATVGRLVGQLDEGRRDNAAHLSTIEQHRKEEEETRTRLRTLEEEVVSQRERLHGSNKACSGALDDLHQAEAKLQRSKDECVVSEHRRQQADVEWRGVLNTLAALLRVIGDHDMQDPAPVQAPQPTAQDVTQALQTRLTDAREAQESLERMKRQLNNVEEQVSVQAELYAAATKRAQRAEEEARSNALRLRALEADLNAAEEAREDTTTEKDKGGRLLARLIGALGLQELGDEVTADPDLLICRAEQLAKLEADKLVDKTTTVYTLQRKVKGLRESVDRKELHLDMLRRKLVLNDEAAKASKSLEDERDDLLARYRRQGRALERLNGEANELRLQNRDARAQLAATTDYKTRANLLEDRVEELSSKVTELEANRNRHQRKMNQLKEQVRLAGEQVVEERRLGDGALDGVSHEMALVKQALRDTTRREKQLTEFRRVVMEVLGADVEECMGADYDTLGRLQRLVAGQREMASISRRLDDIALPSSRPCSAHTLVSRSSSGRSVSPLRPVSATPAHHLLDHHTHRLPPLEPGIADMDAELRAMTEHAHNHRPTVRPSRQCASPSASSHRASPSSSPHRASPSSSPHRASPPPSINRTCPSSSLHRPSSADSAYRQTPNSSRNDDSHNCHENTDLGPYQAQSPNRDSPSPVRQSQSPARRSPSPAQRSPSPCSGSTLRPSQSPILTRPGSANKRYNMGRASSVSFRDQDNENGPEEDDDENMRE